MVKVDFRRKRLSGVDHKTTRRKPEVLHAGRGINARLKLITLKGVKRTCFKILVDSWDRSSSTREGKDKCSD